MGNSPLGYSICIPVFNQSVGELVGELHRQASALATSFEILLMDDCSQRCKEENRLLQLLPCVCYVELERNIGRSAIRNKLAEMARYQTLVVMDCDAVVIAPDYLRNYLNHAECAVVVGGCRYPETPPQDPLYRLRWFYGKAREERPAAVRSLRPHASFTPFNLLIQKEVLLAMRFDESFKGYGHEDTFFGWQLKREGIPVVHIDNPLIHDHQDRSEHFLQKSEEAAATLWQIYNRMGEERTDFASDIKSLRCFVWLRRLHIDAVVAGGIGILRSLLTRNLLSEHPNIRFLDLLKILWLYREKCRLENR